MLVCVSVLEVVFFLPAPITSPDQLRLSPKTKCREMPRFKTLHCLRAKAAGATDLARKGGSPLAWSSSSTGGRSTTSSAGMWSSAAGSVLRPHAPCRTDPGHRRYDRPPWSPPLNPPRHSAPRPALAYSLPRRPHGSSGKANPGRGQPPWRIPLRKAQGCQRGDVPNPTEKQRSVEGGRLTWHVHLSQAQWSSVKGNPTPSTTAGQEQLR